MDAFRQTEITLLRFHQEILPAIASESPMHYQKITE